MVRIPSAYLDPLEQIWLAAATELRLTIVRDPSVYASTDGKGTLTIATPESLDPDDCLAQMILHEICHWLTEGEDSVYKEDWGLPNLPEQIDEAAKNREHACLRLQAALLHPYGLKQLLAPTTEFRTYYDQLPENPLLDTKTDETTNPNQNQEISSAPFDQSSWTQFDQAIPLAQIALQRARKAPYHQVLTSALAKTATIHRMMSQLTFRANSAHSSPLSSSPPAGCSTSLSSKASLPSLWQVTPPPALHLVGFPLSKEHKDQTCQSCAWYQTGGKNSHCQKAKVFFSESKLLPSQTPACVMYETALDCQTCAACCRNFFELVPVRKKDALFQKKPELVQKQGSHFYMKRTNLHCIALETSSETSSPPLFACNQYENRPQTCRDFTQGSSSCLLARQKLGISL